MALGSSFSYYYGSRSDTLWVHHNRVPRLPDLAAPRPGHRLCRGARRPTRPRQRLRRARRPGDSRRRGAAPRPPRALSPGRSPSAARPDRRRTRRGPGPPQLRPRRRRPLHRARHQDARWRASGRERRAAARRPGRAAGRGRARGRALATDAPGMAARCGSGARPAPDRRRRAHRGAGARGRHHGPRSSDRAGDRRDPGALGGHLGQPGGLAAVWTSHPAIVALARGALGGAS